MKKNLLTIIFLSFICFSKAQWQPIDTSNVVLGTLNCWAINGSDIFIGADGTFVTNDNGVNWIM